MLRKLFLLLCLAFFGFAFVWPSIMLPMTDYTCKVGDVTYTCNFKFNGKVSLKSSLGSSNEQENFYYKLDVKNKEITIYADKNDSKGSTISKLKVDNIYTLSGVLGVEYKNNIAMWASVGVGVLAVVLVITAPSKRRS